MVWVLVPLMTYNPGGYYINIYHDGADKIAGLLILKNDLSL